MKTVLATIAAFTTGCIIGCATWAPTQPAADSRVIHCQLMLCLDGCYPSWDVNRWCVNQCIGQYSKVCFDANLSWDDCGPTPGETYKAQCGSD